MKEKEEKLKKIGQNKISEITEKTENLLGAVENLKPQINEISSLLPELIDEIRKAETEVKIVFPKISRLLNIVEKSLNNSINLKSKLRNSDKGMLKNIPKVFSEAAEIVDKDKEILQKELSNNITDNELKEKLDILVNSNKKYQNLITEINNLFIMKELANQETVNKQNILIEVKKSLNEISELLKQIPAREKSITYIIKPATETYNQDKVAQNQDENLESANRKIPTEEANKNQKEEIKKIMEVIPPSRSKKQTSVIDKDKVLENLLNDF